MLSTLTQTEIQDILDHGMCDVTHQIGRFPLQKQDRVLSGDICTVHTTFEGGYQAALALCADTALFARLARNVMRSENVSQQDIRDVATEYFNIICGRVVAGLFQSVRVSSRFRIPCFRPGPYLPEEKPICSCVLKYHCACQEHAHLIYMGLKPCTDQSPRT